MSEKSFQTLEVLNDEAKGIRVLRADLSSEKDAIDWIEQYREETFTGWIVNQVRKEKDCVRYLMHVTNRVFLTKSINTCTILIFYW